MEVVVSLARPFQLAMPIVLIAFTMARCVDELKTLDEAEFRCSVNKRRR